MSSRRGRHLTGWLTKYKPANPERQRAACSLAIDEHIGQNSAMMERSFPPPGKVIRSLLMNRLSVMLMLLSFHCRLAFAAAPVAELIEVNRIWDQAPHNAFTDLIHWNGHFVCAFREGRGHVSSDGRIRVLTSSDGKNWQPAALVALADFDLRDAGLSVAPDGRLMLIGGAAPRRKDHETAPTGTFVSFSDDAVTWTQPAIAVEPGRWLWRVAWSYAVTDFDEPNRILKVQGVRAYGISYATGTSDRTTALLVSGDGLQYRKLVSKLLDDGYPTEAILRFDADETLYCLQRRDGQSPKNTAMLGVSRPPYIDWQWHNLGIFFGGPNFIKIPSGQWIAAGRVIRDGVPTTELAWLDVKRKTLKPILQLPSGGDTSYPGLVWHDGTLWVSYYSSHEGKANIYMAKVSIE
jgi:hypothetical protein